ncbi:MAG TPA: response regulator [Candidatus Paceibacterota bacterium]|nr:response regulator [Candidatus Paceibacterota bacterium]
MNLEKKILVVEDERPLSDALYDRLTREGFSVLVAHDGEEGLSIAIRERPDLILLDVVMPVMDGLSMLKRLREDPWGTTAVVILLTNLSETAKVAEVLEQNVSDFLVKTDWKLQEVVAKVRSRLHLPPSSQIQN